LKYIINDLVGIASFIGLPPPITRHVMYFNKGSAYYTAAEPVLFS